MANGADHLTFGNLGGDSFSRDCAHVHAADVVDLIAADVVKIHQVGRELTTTVRAQAAFELIDKPRQFVAPPYSVSPGPALSEGLCCARTICAYIRGHTRV